MIIVTMPREKIGGLVHTPEVFVLLWRAWLTDKVYEEKEACEKEDDEGHDHDEGL